MQLTLPLQAVNSAPLPEFCADVWENSSSLSTNKIAWKYEPPVKSEVIGKLLKTHWNLTLKLTHFMGPYTVAYAWNNVNELLRGRV